MGEDLLISLGRRARGCPRSQPRALAGDRAVVERDGLGRVWAVFVQLWGLAGVRVSDKHLHHMCNVPNTDTLGAVKVFTLAALLFLGDRLRQLRLAVRLQAGQERRPPDAGDGGPPVLVVGIEVDRLEPGLVVVAPAGLVAQGIGPAAVLDEIKDGVKRGLVAVDGRRQSGERAFGCQQLLAERLLLLADDVLRDGALHGLLGPLVALAADAGDALAQAPLLMGGGRAGAPQLLRQLLAQLGRQGGREGLLLPLPGDGGLDLFQRQPGQVARRAAAVPPGAVK